MATERCRHDKKAPQDLILDLPENQGGAGRHKCAVCAYDAGFKAGYERGLAAARSMFRLTNTAEEGS